MNYDLAKKNRLKGKFNFKLRDWHVELDGLEDPPRVPLRNGRPRKQEIIWKRDRDSTRTDTWEESSVG